MFISNAKSDEMGSLYHTPLTLHKGGRINKKGSNTITLTEHGQKIDIRAFPMARKTEK